MSHSTVWAAVCFAFVALSSPLRAQFVWDFTASASAPSSGSVAGIASVVLTQGNTSTTGIDGSSADASYAGASTGNNLQFRAKSGAVLDKETATYFEITLTPDTDYLISLTDLSFGSRSTPSGPRRLEVYSSANEFATVVAGFDVLNNEDWTLQSVSGLSLQGPANSTVTLRIYGYGGTGTAANWRIDDVILTASASAVPEPGAIAAFAGLAALALAAHRQHRRRATAVGPTDFSRQP